MNLSGNGSITKSNKKKHLNGLEMMIKGTRNRFVFMFCSNFFF